MKILVTGANGYLGRGLVDTLIAQKHDVIATDLLLDSVNEKAFKKVANIFEIANPYEYFGKPDVLLHLAWQDGFVLDSSAHFENLSAHTKFLAKFFNSDVNLISVMGTMHEIGFHEGSINGMTIARPMNYYGIAKDSLRKFVTLMSEKTGKNHQWLRAYYIVGNSVYGNSIFSKIVQAEQEGKKEFPFTTGKNQYDFLDYEEFAKRVSLAVTQNEVTGTIDVASGEPMKLSERVEKFIKDNNYEIKLKYGVFPDRKHDSLAVWGDSEKIDSIIAKHENELKI